ncbi:hypothetical protein [Desulfobulbus oligotrophicus]|nr:hypothetical protein [Desulfobulbus oligotrophicus]
MPLLPPLRQDLQLHPVAPNRDGSPAWTIQDPVANRFYRIGWLEFACLQHWSPQADRIAAAVAASTPMPVATEQVEAFARFLEQHQLLRLDGEAMARMAASARVFTWHHWRWWLRHYLFVRIPLVRPERLLRAMLPLLRPLAGRSGLITLVFASLLGIFLTTRQWDVFIHSVAGLLTPAGLAGFILAIIVCKTCHELGHALVATHFGVRVGHMGIALMVLWPMLYTDVGESWKLRSGRQRLAVSVAGLGSELALAGLATLVWALLDDGLARQAALYAATTGWIVSLAINASPFMRFDGYFILSDLLDIPNLHERSGLLARHWLRNRLLGWQETDAESFSRRMRSGLIIFAFMTWCYRLVVFAGIAAAVYFFFFKAFGVVLFVVEISWFIFRPIVMEIGLWVRRRREIVRGRLMGIILLLMTAGTVLAWPWASHITAPAVAHPGRQQLVFSPFAAQVVRLHPPGQVHAGEVLALFESPDLVARNQQNRALVHGLRQKLAGISVQAEEMDQRPVVSEQLTMQLAEVAAVQDERNRLEVRAAFTGLWLDTDPLLRQGTWISPQSRIGLLVAPRRWIVDVYVEQHQVEQIRIGAVAMFHPERGWQSFRGKVTDIETSPCSQLISPLFDARRGGPVATREDAVTMEPVDVLYRVRLELAEPLPINREIRGWVRIDAPGKSRLAEMGRQLFAVLIRESGF